MLTISDHRRDVAGLRYVYPVVSRRAGGVSIGINLNVNRACNWACRYCQVEGLRRGGPEPIDLPLLESELEHFLQAALYGDFMATQVPESARRLMDLAFSGDGEPTTAAEFPQTVELALAALHRHGLADTVKLRLITNGSQLHRAAVQAGVARLGAAGGEVWFKLDRGSAAGRLAVNGSRSEDSRVVAHLRRAVALAPTWVQTCWFAENGVVPSAAEEQAYLEILRAAGAGLAGVHLYGLARKPMQPGAESLSSLTAEALTGWGGRIASQLGIEVRTSP
ncbi:MAG: hypothetical protein RIR00_983 [Pseudomonadota bacterium]|jgi:hypothetical protein